VVADILPKAAMSSVNIAEVTKFLVERKGHNPEQVSFTVRSLIQGIIPFDEEPALISSTTKS